VWAAYKQLVKDGTPMPPDHELLPPETRPAGEARSGPRHWVYPSPVRQGAAWPHYGAVTIGPLREVVTDPLPGPEASGPRR
jgi:hypothetical protein